MRVALHFADVLGPLVGVWWAESSLTGDTLRSSYVDADSPWASVGRQTMVSKRSTEDGGPDWPEFFTSLAERGQGTSHWDAVDTTDPGALLETLRRAQGGPMTRI